eukprot:544637_1
MVVKLLFVTMILFIYLYMQQLSRFDANIDAEINISNTIVMDNLPPLPNASCSKVWRKHHQIPRSVDDLRRLSKAVEDLYQYKFRLIPQGTFTYWLSHIESKHMHKQKAFFADKFLVKQYIEQFKAKYSLFNSINYARILYDLNNGLPPYETLRNLSQYHGFVLKPNHMSTHQFIIAPNQTVTHEKYQKIRGAIKHWSRRKHKVSKKVEGWYQLIKPHIFIEENLNINPQEYPMIEYKLHVFNYKALFCYVVKKGNFPNNQTYILNNYILPEFEYLNIHWSSWSNNSYMEFPKPQNLNLMIKFAETFAKEENFRYLRVDLYEINNIVYFSEFTFAPISGLGIIAPISFDYCLYDILCDNKQDDINKLYEYVR